MKKSVLIPLTIISVIIIILCIVCIVFYLLGDEKSEIRVSDFSQSASHITIFDGSTGKGITVYDENDVKYVASDLSNLVYKKTRKEGDTDGFLYSVSIFDSQDNLLWKGTINAENSVVIGKNVYTPSRKLDIKYIKNLLNSNS